MQFFKLSSLLFSLFFCWNLTYSFFYALFYFLFIVFFPFTGSFFHLFKTSWRICHVEVKFLFCTTLTLFLLLFFQAHPRPVYRPSPCPRFLSHMKARPEDLRPPCFLSTKSRPQPPSQGRTLNTRILPAPRTQALEGEAYQQNTWCFHTSRRRAVTPLTPHLCSLPIFLPFSSSPGAVEATKLVVSS